MMWTARQYLGNSNVDESLLAQLQQAQAEQCYLDVDIDPLDNAKGRIYTRTRTGDSLGIIKDRSFKLKEGDIYQTDEGKLIHIHLKAEKVMVIRWNESEKSNGLELIHLGHTLGNHHWPIIIQDDCILVQLVFGPEAIEVILQPFQIPGLSYSYEDYLAGTLEFPPKSHAGHSHSSGSFTYPSPDNE